MGVALMIISAAVFVATEGTSRVAEQSQALHELDELQRWVEARRAGLGFATHFVSLADQLGWDLADELDALLVEQESVAEAMQPFADRADIPEVVDFDGVADRLTLAIEAGDASGAQRIAETDFVRSSELAGEAVSAARSEALAKIIDIDRMDARIGDAARFVVVLLVPVAVVLIYREIVERQLRHRQLEMQLEAEQALAQARDEFVANASHELRTPLTGILGLSELLVDDDRIPADARDMLGMVTTEAADLARMVEDLLTTARLSAGQLRFEPRRVPTVEEAEVVVRPFIQAGQLVETDVCDAAVYVDRLRQRQVLRNLISNAVKYGGDTIRLEGRAEPLEYVWIVADNGPGVPKELEGRLFQRYIHTLTFQQAVAGGVGLGLSIVKSLVDGMGGAVSYARVGDESHFVVRLPLADGSSGDRPSIRAFGGVR
jgi:signal transduction histidine kinase